MADGAELKLGLAVAEPALRLPRSPSPARSAPRRTYSTRGIAGTARAAPCCDSGSARRRADRDRRRRRASAPSSDRRAAGGRLSADSVCQIAWCSASAWGLWTSASKSSLERVLTAGRARRDGARAPAGRASPAGWPRSAARRARGTDPARRAADRRLRAARTPDTRAPGDASIRRSQAATASAILSSWKRTSPRLSCAGAFRASRSIAASKRRAASVIVAPLQRLLAELVLEERQDLVVPRCSGRRSRPTAPQASGASRRPRPTGAAPRAASRGSTARSDSAGPAAALQ